MLKPYFFHGSLELRSKIILEPSAGKGDILDYIDDKTFNSNHKIYCIEQSQELQAILRDKHHKLIDTDFLKHAPDFDYNLIVMNPPFDRADEHLLKAWDIMENGDIVCLLNEETINNPYSKKRELLKSIIDEHGTVEYLGDCFATSERKTGVNVALVRLLKKTEKNKFSFDDLKDREEIVFNDDFIENGIATRDVIENICIQYEQVKKDYIEMLKYKNKIRQYTANLTSSDWKLREEHGLEGSEDAFLDFVNDLKMKIWENIATKTKLEKYMTSKARSDFNSYLNEQGSLGITKDNIQSFISVIFQNRFMLLEKSIDEVFDMFTKYYDENRCHIEGWKTNDKWKVNKKVILPNCIELPWSGVGFYKANYSRYSEFTDIEKCMCYLTGKNFENIKQIEDTIKEISVGDSDWQDTEFFEIRCYKKGTIHLKFKDEWLWQEFNMRACEGKNWLPEAEKKEWKKKKEHLRLN